MAAAWTGAKFGVQQNTLSANLSIFARSGLNRTHKEGRGVRFFTAMDSIRSLLALLMQDCSGLRRNLWQPVTKELPPPDMRGP